MEGCCSPPGPRIATLVKPPLVGISGNAAIFHPARSRMDWKFVAAAGAESGPIATRVTERDISRRPAMASVPSVLAPGGSNSRGNSAGVRPTVIVGARLGGPTGPISAIASSRGIIDVSCCWPGAVVDRSVQSTREPRIGRIPPPISRVSWEITVAPPQWRTHFPTMAGFHRTIESYRQGARTMPREKYTSAEVFADERERIFAQYWNCV